ncbi:MAG: cbb3-type cytochrome c oxidase subunit 3 [Gallionellaceae bacterium]|nr:cbb3-type cytochrome c oxidase subunit 3 [Gallionellaceae bacterium]
MDAGTVGSVVTVVFFVLFIVIVWWAFLRGNKQKFDDAAQLPFQEDAVDAGKRQTD